MKKIRNRYLLILVHVSIFFFMAGLTEGIFPQNYPALGMEMEFNRRYLVFKYRADNIISNGFSKDTSVLAHSGRNVSNQKVPGFNIISNLPRPYYTLMLGVDGCTANFCYLELISGPVENVELREELKQVYQCFNHALEFVSSPQQAHSFSLDSKREDIRGFFKEHNRTGIAEWAPAFGVSLNLLFQEHNACIDRKEEGFHKDFWILQPFRASEEPEEPGKRRPEMEDTSDVYFTKLNADVQYTTHLNYGFPLKNLLLPGFIETISEIDKSISQYQIKYLINNYAWKLSLKTSKTIISILSNSIPWEDKDNIQGPKGINFKELRAAIFVMLMKNSLPQRESKNGLYIQFRSTPLKLVKTIYNKSNPIYFKQFIRSVSPEKHREIAKEIFTHMQQVEKAVRHLESQSKHGQKYNYARLYESGSRTRKNSLALWVGNIFPFFKSEKLQQFNDVHYFSDWPVITYGPENETGIILEVRSSIPELWYHPVINFDFYPRFIGSAGMDRILRAIDQIRKKQYLQLPHPAH